jgi:tRNA(Ile)-lysidine synthase
MQSCLELIPDDTQRVFLAFSGGMDSSVLLHLLLSAKQGFQIIPWHVNHGLQLEASAMEQFCIRQAQQLGLEIRIDRLEMDSSASNIEAEARRQRYQLFEQHSATGDCVLTAHHAGDQAETFLLNALRGSGSAGLRGIARQRNLGKGLLLRPLLDFSREQLEEYARHNELVWFDDPSNQSDRFDRNYLRNRVIPRIRTRWPRFEKSLITSCEIQFEIQALLDEIAEMDCQALQSTGMGEFPTLSIDGLLQLSERRRKNLLRFWVGSYGLPGIPRARMQELMKQLLAKAAAIPEIALPGYSIRRYDQRLFLVPAGEAPVPAECYEFTQEPQVEIEVLNLKRPRSEIFNLLEIEDSGQSLALRFRDDGQQNNDRHRLKRLFQKHRIPPWERSTVPQVYLDGKLAGLLR